MDAWQANPHEYGPGKVHWVVADPFDPAHQGSAAKTLCGKVLRACPGRLVEDAEDRRVTCQICRNKVAGDQDRARRQEQYARENAQREAEHAEQNRQWWAWYTEYLESPQWKHRRRLVLERDGGICQGCRIREAAHVHHRTYARVGHEMLFDLIAVCDDCHQQIHEEGKLDGARVRQH